MAPFVSAPPLLTAAALQSTAAAARPALSSLRRRRVGLDHVTGPYIPLRHTVPSPAHPARAPPQAPPPPPPHGSHAHAPHLRNTPHAASTGGASEAPSRALCPRCHRRGWGRRRARVLCGVATRALGGLRASAASTGTCQTTRAAQGQGRRRRTTRRRRSARRQASPAAAPASTTRRTTRTTGPPLAGQALGLSRTTRNVGGSRAGGARAKKRTTVPMTGRRATAWRSAGTRGGTGRPPSLPAPPPFPAHRLATPNTARHAAARAPPLRAADRPRITAAHPTLDLWGTQGADPSPTWAAAASAVGARVATVPQHRQSVAATPDSVAASEHLATGLLAQEASAAGAARAGPAGPLRLWWWGGHAPALARLRARHSPLPLRAWRRPLPARCPLASWAGSRRGGHPGRCRRGRRAGAHAAPWPRPSLQPQGRRADPLSAPLRPAAAARRLWVGHQGRRLTGDQRTLHHKHQHQQHQQLLHLQMLQQQQAAAAASMYGFPQSSAATLPLAASFPCPVTGRRFQAAILGPRIFPYLAPLSIPRRHWGP